MNALLLRHRIVLAYVVVCTALYVAGVIDCWGVHDGFLCGYDYLRAAFFLTCPASYGLLVLTQALPGVPLSDHAFAAGAVAINALLLGGAIEWLKRLRSR